MEASIPSTTLFFKSSLRSVRRKRLNPNLNQSPNLIYLPVTTFEPVQDEITWEIIVGTLAGVIPSVVAGIEFSKRIVAQKRCTVCRGSGLVRREKYYFRCPRCGGFLPWQSWKRFFS
ncbi:hypothetical protein MKX01_039798 [Papaver californicum]|nr:hypothetical protein MKX01_039798 [Papaver californicum]